MEQACLTIKYPAFSYDKLASTEFSHRKLFLKIPKYFLSVLNSLRENIFYFLIYFNALSTSYLYAHIYPINFDLNDVKMCKKKLRNWQRDKPSLANTRLRLCIVVNTVPSTSPAVAVLSGMPKSMQRQKLHWHLPLPLQLAAAVTVTKPESSIGAAFTVAFRVH